MLPRRRLPEAGGRSRHRRRLLWWGELRDGDRVRPHLLAEVDDALGLVEEGHVPELIVVLPSNAPPGPSALRCTAGMLDLNTLAVDGRAGQVGDGSPRKLPGREHSKSDAGGAAVPALPRDGHICSAEAGLRKQRDDVRLCGFRRQVGDGDRSDRGGLGPPRQGLVLLLGVLEAAHDVPRQKLDVVRIQVLHHRWVLEKEIQDHGVLLEHVRVHGVQRGELRTVYLRQLGGLGRLCGRSCWVGRGSKRGRWHGRGKPVASRGGGRLGACACLLGGGVGGACLRDGRLL
mmetsp:Transcript_48088/g.138488  ORF Transcript_48088/g.138488 Transcript_48088/m.138488 type:complete len:288 (-) Transcript_48088:49-912(-)